MLSDNYESCRGDTNNLERLYERVSFILIDLYAVDGSVYHRQLNRITSSH